MFILIIIMIIIITTTIPPPPPTTTTTNNNDNHNWYGCGRPRGSAPRLSGRQRRHVVPSSFHVMDVGV